MRISRRIRSLRQERRLSPGGLAAKSGLPADYVLELEEGRTVPPRETLERLATALEVPLVHLFCAGPGDCETRFLTPRVSLQELANRDGGQGGGSFYGDWRAWLSGIWW